MYTLRITDNNNVITTVKESLMEKSNCVNSIQIIINKLYKEQIDMTDTTAYMLSMMNTMIIHIQQWIN